MLGRDGSLQGRHQAVNSVVDESLVVPYLIGFFAQRRCHVVMKVAVPQMAESDDAGTWVYRLHQLGGTLHEHGNIGYRQRNIVFDVFAILDLGQWNVLPDIPKLVRLSQRVELTGTVTPAFAVVAVTVAGSLIL